MSLDAPRWGASARRARDRGVQGVVVSNHRGRQVDAAIAALDTLPDVVDAVADDLTVLFDSGIRSGADVVKALALGADSAARPPVSVGVSGRGRRRRPAGDPKSAL